MRRKDYQFDDELYPGSLLDDELASELHDAVLSEHARKYRRHADNAAKRQAKQSEEGREIGPLPACLHPDIVEACRYDLLLFMLTFGNSEFEPEPAFPDPFCPAQLYAISVVQETILSGGCRPLCLPRGFAKSTICEWGIIWALVYGHQTYILVVAAKHEFAMQILSNVLKIIKENELFIACFPALCYPIACLDESPGRGPGQTLDGHHTYIMINSRRLVCPTVVGAPSSGAIVSTSGLDSAIRGLKSGKRRPGFVIVDDPQTLRSAKSPTQTQNRWESLSGCIKGLANQKVHVGIVATITVQRPGDLSEKILDEWGGDRFSILRSMPSNMELWNEYGKLRRQGLHQYTKTADQVRECNAFYLAHQAEMDEGAEPEWPESFTPFEHSAIQHAMNFYCEDKKVFYAEYMNRPLAIYDESRNLTYEEVTRKVIPISRCTVPIDCERVTSAIDIQEDCLYWIVVAWGTGFRGHVLDYGRFPSGSETIQDIFPTAGKKDAFYMALMELYPLLSSRVFQREDGSNFTISKGLVDANRGLFTPQVRKACFDFKGVWEPTFGWGKGPNSNFIRGNERPGEERGDCWQRLPLFPSNLVRHTRYDTNYWKSLVRTCIQAPVRGSGTLTFFDASEVAHWDFFQMLLSERSNQLTGARGTMDEWVLIPDRDNHLWDCLVMASVANSVEGGHFQSNAPATAGPSVVYSGNWSAIGR